MAETLTSRERAQLKARAHALEPVVHVGHAGVSEALIAEIDRALTAHELIKVRLTVAERKDRAELIDAICAGTEAAEVQRVGKIVVLWRPLPEDD